MNSRLPVIVPPDSGKAELFGVQLVTRYPVAAAIVENVMHSPARIVLFAAEPSIVSPAVARPIV